MYKATQIADHFLLNVNHSSGDTVSHLKLQKLVYYAQAWHYTLFNEPLFDEKIEAWMHGPVIRSVYDKFNIFRVYMPINPAAVNLENIEFDAQTASLLDDIETVYGEHSASYLEKLTHSEAPWVNARKGYESYQRCNEEITLEAMREYYSTLLGKE